MKTVFQDSTPKSNDWLDRLEEQSVEQDAHALFNIKSCASVSNFRRHNKEIHVVIATDTTLIPFSVIHTIRTASMYPTLTHTLYMSL